MATTPPAEDKHVPLLVLDTLAPERQTVLIRTKTDRRGKHYEIVTPADLSLHDQAEIGRLKTVMDDLAPRIVAAFDGGEATDSDLALFEQTTDRFLRLVFRGLPQQVLNLLRISQKEQLVEAFIQASPDLAQAVMTAREATPALARRSLGSSGSMAAPRKRGSTSGRKRS